MNKRAGIFLIAIIVLIVLLMSYGIVYFRFTSSGLEVLAGNTTVSLGYDNNVSVSDSNSSSETKSQPLNLGVNDSSTIVVNTSAANTAKSNRTKIEIIEVNISK